MRPSSHARIRRKQGKGAALLVPSQGLKVVHFTSVHPPNDNRIFLKQCRSLVRAGYYVVLVVPSHEDTVQDGVTIRSVRQSKSRLGRMLGTTWRVFRTVLKENADIYHFHDPELIGYGLILRLLGRRVVYDVHEDYVTSIRQKRYLPRPIRNALSAVFGWCEAIAAKAFSAVVLAERYYKQRFPSGTTVLNYPDLDTLYLPTNKRETNPHGPRRRKRLLYTGNVTIDRGALIYAMMVRDIQGIEITIVGRCEPDLAEHMRNVAGAGASRLTIIGEGCHVPFERIVDIYHSETWLAGIAIFPMTPHYVRKELTKLFEYMAMGIPIICSNFPTWRALVQGSGVGLCVDPEDTNAIQKTIATLAANDDLVHEMRQRGKELVQTRFNWANEARALLDLYESLMPTRP